MRLRRSSDGTENRCEGFSPRNLKSMRAFAKAWLDEPIVQQLAAQILGAGFTRIAR